MSNVMGVPSQHGLAEQGLRNLNMEYWTRHFGAILENVQVDAQECPGVPSAILNPRNTWKNPEAYDRQARTLAGAFKENFAALSGTVSAEVAAAGPA
jgi:ATP-dependent phosphoenolpyruvate carboxykinase